MTGQTAPLDLTDQEILVWQGQPLGGWAVRRKLWIPVGLSLGLTVAAGVWMVVTFDQPGGIWTYAFPHAAVGLVLAFGAMLWDKTRREATQYYLTSQRGIIETRLPVLGLSRKSYDIVADAPLSYDDSIPGNVYFAREMHRTSKGQNHMVDIGFEHITDGARVLQLVRQVQKDAQ